MSECLIIANGMGHIFLSNNLSLTYYSHYSMNACLAPLCSMHGLSVTTVEGIGSVKNGLHPVQVRRIITVLELINSHASISAHCD